MGVMRCVPQNKRGHCAHRCERSGFEPIARPDSGQHERVTKVERLDRIADVGYPVFTGVAECKCAKPGNDRAQISRLPLSTSFFQSTITISTLPFEMPTSLDYLKATGTVVVSDSGDFECKIVYY